MFRFTIRDVLWVTVVVAMGVAWWIGDAQLRAAFDAERSVLSQQVVVLKGDVRKWEGRAGAVAQTMRNIGIPVEFREETRGMSVGPIPPHIDRPAR